MTEWPLAGFTLALQMACGLCLAATLFDVCAVVSQDAAMRRAALSIFPVTLLGLLASLFHLGRPLSAVRALTNLGSSRLSLEIALSALFAAATLVYGYLWFRRIRPTRVVVGIVTTLLGLAALISSFWIYMIPSQPAWNSGWLPISFAGTFLVFAGMIPVCLIQFEDRRFLRVLLGLGLAGGLALLASVTWMIAALSRSGADDFSAARLQAGLHLIISTDSFWFGAYLFLAVLLPFSFALRLWPRKEAVVEVGSLRMLVVVALLGGMFIGRLLMYALGAALPLF